MVAALALVTPGEDAGLRAQELNPTSTPVGVQIRVIDQSYGIQGGDAATLLDQIRSGRMASFPYTYRWRYRTRTLPSVAGFRTQQCAVDDITIEFTVRSTYPRWENRPEDAPEELLEAWSVFEGQLEALWRERQQAMEDFAREARREVLRLEEGCPILAQITNGLVERTAERMARRERERAQAGERTRLKWPPDGFGHLVTAPREASDPGEPTVPDRVGTGRAADRPPADEAPPTARGRRPPPLPPADRAVDAPSGGLVGIERVLASDVGTGGMLGAVAGLSLAGELDYLGAAGLEHVDGPDPLGPEAHFRVPGFTDVVVAAIATALEGDGVIDTGAPISTYLRELKGRLGVISLHDLMAHRSGLDDARPSDSVWSRILDDLDDRAVFTGPDVVDSYSRYDYPLAVRVLERATGSDLGTLAERLVFEPAGMSETRLEPSPSGLPVATTTAADLLAFGSALADGSVAMANPSVADARWAAVASTTGLNRGGLRWDAPAGVRRLSLMCRAGPGTDAAALQVYPEHDAVLVLWARPKSSSRVWPATVARIIVEDLGSKLGLGPAVFEPRRLKGAADLQTDPRTCDEPSWNPEIVSEPGPPAVAADWAGSYTNGDRRVTLENREGALWLTDDTPQQVARYDGDIHFATINGLALYPLRLIEDDAGDRYVVLHGRAYIHDEDGQR